MRLSELAELEQEQAIAVAQAPIHAAHRIAALSRQLSRQREELEQMRSERDALLLELDQVAPRFRLLADVTFEIFTVSEANLSEHHMARAKRTARQKDATLAALAARFGGTAGPQLLAQHGRLLVSLVRLGARRLDDDNLAGSLKHVRDAVAYWLGCNDDARAPVRWSIGQEPSPRNRVRPGVRVEIYAKCPRTGGAAALEEQPLGSTGRI